MPSSEPSRALQAKAAETAARLRRQHGDAATEILSHLMHAARAERDRGELDHLALVYQHLARGGAQAGAPAPEA